MTTDYTPRPEHHFTFGLWTVGNPGRDPFGDPVRAPIPPTRIVEQLAKPRCCGVGANQCHEPRAAAERRDLVALVERRAGNIAKPISLFPTCFATLGFALNVT